jgi:DNA helicase-2/ATP-dependent DNA helicase PcrA
MSGAIPLNPAQKAAIEHRGSPALVLAGAGSGKTRVITQRIARLIGDGYPAPSIYAVTFTNKASEEMAERLEKLVGETGKRVWISTFHALGAEIARKEARLIAGGDRFVVYDAADAMGVVKEILRDLKVLDRRYDAGAILARVSRAKSAMTTPEELEDGGEYDEITRAVFPRYQATLARLKALDFDDLIGAPLKLLQENEEVRERWQSTSSRIRTARSCSSRRRSRVCVPKCSASATTTRRSTDGAARTFATCSTSRSTSPALGSWRSSRITDRVSRSSMWQTW